MSFVAPNGVKLTLTITDNPKDIQLYRKLKLDVFTYVESKPLKPIEPSEMSWADLKKYAKKHNIEGKNKKEILDAITERAK